MGKTRDVFLRRTAVFRTLVAKMDKLEKEPATLRADTNVADMKMHEFEAGVALNVKEMAHLRTIVLKNNVLAIVAVL